LNLNIICYSVCVHVLICSGLSEHLFWGANDKKKILLRRNWPKCSAVLKLFSLSLSLVRKILLPLKYSWEYFPTLYKSIAQCLFFQNYNINVISNNFRFINYIIEHMTHVTWVMFHLLPYRLYDIVLVVVNSVEFSLTNVF